MKTSKQYKIHSLYHRRTECLNRLDKILARIRSNPRIIVKAIKVKIKAKSDLYRYEFIILCISVISL